MMDDPFLSALPLCSMPERVSLVIGGVVLVDTLGSLTVSATLHLFTK